MKKISGDNRYDHDGVRENVRMLMPVSGTKAAKQRSEEGTYRYCGAVYINDIIAVFETVFGH